MEEIKIMSTSKCDEAYGKMMVQYQAGDVTTFAYTDIDLSWTPEKEDQVKEQIRAGMSKYEMPSWKDLSEDLIETILDADMDMRFIEYEDEDWSDEKADKIYVEACKHSLDGAITRGEDECYLTIYPGVMQEINWADHPYLSGPCLDSYYVEQAVAKELLAKDGVFQYRDFCGDINYVSIDMGTYEYYNNLYVGLMYYDPTIGEMDVYGDITVNTLDLPYLQAAIDVNNNGPGIVDFIRGIGLAKPTTYYVEGGFVNFPIMEFSEEFLEKYCPDKMKEYKKCYGKLESLDSKINKINPEGLKENDDKRGISTGAKDSDKGLSSGGIPER